MILALGALLMAAAIASASVEMTWTTQYGAYTHDSPDVTGYDDQWALAGSYAVTWQLIYAGANNLIDPIDLGNPLGGWVSGDDAVWATRSIPQGGGSAGDGTAWNEWLVHVSGNATYVDTTWNTPGFVYQRVYEDAPAPGSWYYESELVELDTSKGDGAPPQRFYIDELNSGFQPNLTIPIPEPATMGLLGLGALVMALRRRRA
jgi:hypothetical protein